MNTNLLAVIQLFVAIVQVYIYICPYVITFEWIQRFIIKYYITVNTKKMTSVYISAWNNTKYFLIFII